MTDLWPADVATAAAKSPYTILREQAALLGAKTNNIVKAAVRDASANTELAKPFNYNFLITSPALGNYTYRLFMVSYDIGFYPVEFIVDDDIARELGVVPPEFSYGPPQELVASREDEFIRILSRVLGSEKTRRVIGAILSHAMDQGLETGAAAD